MKSVEKTSPIITAAPQSNSSCLLSSAKVQDDHRKKLAIVYVRQSTMQQVRENRESNERQYALTNFAQALGWPEEQILVIDEDQGVSSRAENRRGFQQLLSEVTMGHVGMVLGLEMSRLARTSRDWHHLLEVCSIFNSLLADQDGVYDASDPNDRLLLGLKGTISEVELHTMHNRMHRGLLNKAMRGELFYGVPFGYVLKSKIEVDFDPDEQARAVVYLIFEKFKELGSVNSLFHWLVDHNISLPIRPRVGEQKGELDWRRPSRRNITIMLHHPMYAGAYTFGRREVNHRARYVGSNGQGKTVVKPMDEWLVLLHDRLPAYITWEQFLLNQQRIAQNYRGKGASGAAGKGRAMLGGLLCCGTCGRKMQVSYHSKRKPYYCCERQRDHYVEKECHGLQSQAIDDLVAGQVLRALEPAALELSIQATEDVEQERARLDKHWKQRLKRAGYEATLAQRRYSAVDPDNRQVASSLEKAWEEALLNDRQVQDEHDRYQHESPTTLTPQERESLRSLAMDIPALWNADGLTNVERKEIVRCLIEKVVVHVRQDSEVVESSVHWKGDYVSQHEFNRTVQSYSQLRDSDLLFKRIVELRASHNTTKEIAVALNNEGFLPPRQKGGFHKDTVTLLLKRQNLIGVERSHDELLGENEWWLADLASRLEVNLTKTRYWALRGYVHARQTPIQGYWIAWADKDELARLEKLKKITKRCVDDSESKQLKTPKPRGK
jgi:DNA invertase Pin-like site-specific DNA recombinase